MGIARWKPGAELWYQTLNSGGPLILALCYGAAMGFSAGSALRFGWETFKRRPWFFVGTAFVILLISGLINALTSGIDALFTGSPQEPSLVGMLVDIGLGTLLSMGMTAFYLVAHDSPEAADLSLLWHPQPFWKYLGMSLLVIAAIVVGLILLIVPGIIFALMFMFAPFIVIERELGPVEAMKESNTIARGHKWPLFGLLLLLLLVNLAGLLALVVGLLVSMPVSMLALVHAYRMLSGKVEQRPADAALAA